MNGNHLAHALRDTAGALLPSDPAYGLIHPPPALFNNFLPDDALILVSGESFTGKTMLTLDMALCLDTGLPLFGRFAPPEPKTVLYVGRDAPTYDYVRQLNKLMVGHKLRSEVRSMLEITLLLNRKNHLLDPAFERWLGLYHDATGYDVLFLDTLVSVLPGVDENNNTAMSQVMDKLKSWRDSYGLSIIFTKHLNPLSLLAPTSANYQVRGAKTVIDSSDYHLQLRRAPRTPKAMPGVTTVHLTVPKGRGDYDAPLTFTLTSGLGLDTHESFVTLLAPDTPIDKLLAWLNPLPLPRAKLYRLMRSSLPGVQAVEAKALVDKTIEELQQLNRLTCTSDGWVSLPPHTKEV